MAWKQSNWERARAAPITAQSNTIANDQLDACPIRLGSARLVNCSGSFDNDGIYIGATAEMKVKRKIDWRQIRKFMVIALLISTVVFHFLSISASASLSMRSKTS